MKAFLLSLFVFFAAGSAFAEVTCVAKCVARYPNGECWNWGEDFCGKKASCSPRCIARFPDGKCYNWSEDYCRAWSSGESKCVPNCIARFPDGKCWNWDKDSCH